MKRQARQSCHTNGAAKCFYMQKRLIETYGKQALSMELADLNGG
jgi:hypothetical protein